MSKEWKSRDDISSRSNRGDERGGYKKNTSNEKPNHSRTVTGNRGFKSENKFSKDRKPYGDKPSFDRGERKPYGDKPSFDRGERKPYGDKPSFDRGERKPYGDKPSFDRGDRKPYGDKPSFDRGDRKPYGDKPSFDRGDRKPYGDKPSFDRAERKPYGDKPSFDRGERKPYGDKPSFDRSDRKPYGDKPSFDRGDRKPYGDKPSFDRAERKPYGDKPSFDRGERKPYGDKPSFDKNERKPYGDKPSFDRSDRKPYGDKPSFDRSERKPYGDKPSFDKNERKPYGDKPSFGRGERKPYGDKPSFDRGERKPYGDKPAFERRERKSDGDKFSKPKDDTAAMNGLIRLNRYIANAGVCSRRKADELIELGEIQVNGVVVTELGFKLAPTDKVHCNGQLLRRERMVYVLLNKPKDYITTTDDPRERRTVMELVEKASKERIYPVGRLDRNTTGLLLLTNDGDLADKLSHPKNNIEKLYSVTLDKNIRSEDFERIVAGLELEDGFVKPDELDFVDGGSKKELGIKIHNGKNRIVRRIFEHLGYEVVKLDRVMYAGLTKKDIPRGKWKFLDEKELTFLRRLIN